MPSWWCTGITCAPVHFSPYGCLLYCLPHRKDIILCNHVFSKSQKGKPKLPPDYVSKKKKKVRVHFCVEVKGICVFQVQSCLPVSKEPCLLLCSLLLVAWVSVFSIPIVDLTLDAQICLLFTETLL